MSVDRVTDIWLVLVSDNNEGSKIGSKNHVDSSSNRGEPNCQ